MGSRLILLRLLILQIKISVHIRAIDQSLRITDILNGCLAGDFGILFIGKVKRSSGHFYQLQLENGE